MHQLSEGHAASPEQAAIKVTREIVYCPSPRTAADFEYPLSTGKRVPTAGVDGLCATCDAAWPCTRCPDALEVLGS